jgi:hypothetical protein
VEKEEEGKRSIIIVMRSNIRENKKNKKKKKKEPAQIKELAEKRKILASHLEQLQDGTVERLIKKHLDSCNDMSHFHHYYYHCHHHPTNALEETIVYYKHIVVEQIIEPLQKEVSQLERRSGIIEP